MSIAHWYTNCHIQTPIVPCGGSESHFEQDATNVLTHRPIGKTLLELAATHQSTTDRLLEFDVCHITMHKGIDLHNYTLTGDWI